MSYTRALYTEELRELLKDTPFKEVEEKNVSELYNTSSKGTSVGSSQLSRTFKKLNLSKPVMSVMDDFFSLVNVVENNFLDGFPEDNPLEVLQNYKRKVSGLSMTEGCFYEPYPHFNRNFWLLDQRTKRVLWVLFQWEHRSNKRKGSGETAGVGFHDHVTEESFMFSVWFKYVRENWDKVEEWGDKYGVDTDKLYKYS